MISFKTQKNVIYSLVIFVLFAIISCSTDENDDQTQIEDQVNLLEISGRYVGSFNNLTFDTDGPLSMVISPSDSNTHDVLIFETSFFRPMFNMDGETPELI